MLDTWLRGDGMRRSGIGGRCRALLAFGLTLTLAVAVAACGSRSAAPPPQQSAGTYASAQYHFRLTYPDGWTLTTLPGGSTAIPLSVQISHVGAQTQGTLLSTFTLAVIDTTSAAEATPVAQLKQQIAAAHSSLMPTTLSGHPAYQDAPLQEKSPDGSVIGTRTDYYLLAGRYEYAITTETVSSDSGSDTVLQTMLQSFTLVPS